MKLQKLSYTEPIISNEELKVLKFLKNCLLNFKDECDLYRISNNDDEFWRYNHERTLLSVFFNGIVRDPMNSNVSVLQEFAVRKDETQKFKSVGRCDGFLNWQNSAIYFEAKRSYAKIDNHHWDVEEWNKWDDNIHTQLQKYFNVEVDQNKEFYSSQWLVSIVFHVIKLAPREYLSRYNEFYRNMAISGAMKKNWFSIFMYSDDVQQGISNGLEVYGTVIEVPDKKQ